MKITKKSQTATEYLIILVVVIVIALIVVGVMRWIPLKQNCCERSKNL